MKTVKIILVAFVAFMVMPAMADDFKWLNISYNNGSEESVSLSDFSNITFAQGTMNLNNGTTVVKSFDTKQLRKMYFVADQTAINSATIDIDTNAPVEIVNAAGMVVGNNMNDLQQLQRGIYIVRQGSVVKKIAKK